MAENVEEHRDRRSAWLLGLAAVLAIVAWIVRSRRAAAAADIGSRRPLAPVPSPTGAAVRRPSPQPRTPAAPAVPAPSRDGLPAGAAAALPDGSPRGPEYTIKGNAGSMIFHPPTSPYFARTKAEYWFRTPEEARAAGFTEWTPRRR
jgi:hypothetical protein